MAWYHRLLNVFRPGAVARDLDREIAEGLRAGLGPEQAALNETLTIH